MNTDQLRTFLSLARTKNFSASAKELFVAQSTASKRIAELEKELGTSLFTRSNREVRLTYSGKLFLNYAEQINNLEDRARQSCSKTSGLGEGIRLGSAYDFSTLRLSSCLPSLVRDFPSFSFSLKSGHTSLLISSLKQALLDVIFTHHPLHHLNYECIELPGYDIAMVASASNHTGPTEYTVSQVATLPFIDTNFLYAETRLQLFPFPMDFKVTLDVAENAIPLLKQTDWIAILPLPLIENEIESGELTRLRFVDYDLPPVRCYMIYSKALPSGPLFPIVEALRLQIQGGKSEGQ